MRWQAHYYSDVTRIGRARGGASLTGQYIIMEEILEKLFATQL